MKLCFNHSEESIFLFSYPAANDEYDAG